MKPIKIEPRENPTILEIDEKELLEGYKEVGEIHYMPEFLEKTYKGPNAEYLKKQNKLLEEYANKRNELMYIGSHNYKQGGDEYFIEYYYDKQDIIVYLIEKPKNPKYYTSLQMICVFERCEKNAVN